MTDDFLLATLNRAAHAVREVLDHLEDWGPAGTRAHQYRSDLVADEAAVRVLVDAGLGVVSEESGSHHPDRAIQVVLDPVDGSTNASRSLPWYACSLCAVDDVGLRAAVVVNLATGDRYNAVRGGGATLNGRSIAPTTCTSMGDAIVGLAGWPVRHLGWQQYRALGAAALDICAVAAGQLDAYMECSGESHAPWDYLGAMLVCLEAGAAVGESAGLELVTLGLLERRSPVAAATPALLAEVLAARAGIP